MSDKNKPTESDYARLGKALTYVLERDNIRIARNWKRFILTSLTRGIFVGFGGIIGATIVVALLIWVLNAFGGIPWVGDWFDTIRYQLQSGNSPTNF